MVCSMSWCYSAYRCSSQSLSVSMKFKNQEHIIKMIKEWSKVTIIPDSDTELFNQLFISCLIYIHISRDIYIIIIIDSKMIMLHTLSCSLLATSPR